MLTQRIQNGVNGIIFQKVMRKSVQRDSTFSMGEITNISQDDSAKISNISGAVNRLFIAPLEIIGGAVWLYFLVGAWPLLFGTIIMVGSLYLNIQMSKKWQMYQTKTMDSKDKRGKLISEVFSNIRYIKIAGLENYFLEKIMKAKDEELKWIGANMKRGALSITLNNGVPLIFLLTIFGTYIFINGKLDIPTIFTVMQVFNIFTFNFRAIPYMMIYILDVIIAGQRISFFLLSEEIDASFITQIPKEDEDNEYAVQITQGNFYWEDKTLKRLYKEEKDRIANKKGKKIKQTEEKGKGKKKEVKKTAEELKKEKEEMKEKEKQDKIDRRLLGIRNSLKSIYNQSLDKEPMMTSHVDSLGDFGSSINTFANNGLHSDTDSIVTSPEGQFKSSLIPKSKSGHSVLEMEEAFSDIKLNLKNINIKIPKGKCIGLIGKVGSGKSSLLSCLTGELYTMYNTKVSICGNLSYVSQKAWISSKNIRDNIVFEREFDEQRYNDSIKFSCMEDDLKILENGDLTQLGDKGVNLSGGQKIRLSIARAMYSDSDIYLFDDPISALDIHVGKFVMEEGIVNYLKGKTRIVATHALAYLKFFDYIYVMDNGEIVEQGDFETLKETAIYQEIQLSLNKLREEEEKKKHQEAEKLKNEKAEREAARKTFEDLLPANLPEQEEPAEETQENQLQQNNKNGTNFSESKTLKVER